MLEAVREWVRLKDQMCPSAITLTSLIRSYHPNRVFRLNVFSTFVQSRFAEARAGRARILGNLRRVLKRS